MQALMAALLVSVLQGQPATPIGAPPLYSEFQAGGLGCALYTKRDLKQAAATRRERRRIRFHAFACISSGGDLAGAFLRGGKGRVVCTFTGVVDWLTGCAVASGCGTDVESCL